MSRCRKSCSATSSGGPAPGEIGHAPPGQDRAFVNQLRSGSRSPRGFELERPKPGDTVVVVAAREEAPHLVPPIAERVLTLVGRYDAAVAAEARAAGRITTAATQPRHPGPPLAAAAK